jgi:hypothetical protein
MIAKQGNKFGNLQVHRGSCLCGKVRFEIKGALAQPDACHCSICRKHSGHFFVSTDVPRETVVISGEDDITWFQSSDKARRGFCRSCGSSLFWDPLFKDWIGIAMGAFETPTKTKVKMHIFTANKGDYYEISDGICQFQQVPN